MTLNTQDIKLNCLQQIAKKRGGCCLSKTFVRLKDKLLWKCAKGHTWTATGQSIKHQKSWCPKCIGRIHDIEYMKKLAAKKGGLCLSKHFVAVTKKLSWQCNQGHKWATTPSAIKQGTWCPTCVSNKHTIADMQKFAKKNKAICLSKKYENGRGKLKWICKNGHTFYASYEYIKRRDRLCINCKLETCKTIRLQNRRL